MELLLHIGTGKTGSTSIQSFLKKNRKRLLEGGTLFPRSLGDSNHYNLFLIAQNSAASDKPMRMRGIVGREQQKIIKAKWRKEFKEEVADSKADRCIVSAEHLSQLKEDEVLGLRDFLCGVFNRVKILIYLRDPVDYAVSMYDTALKIGGLRQEPLPPEYGGPADYKQILRMWSGAFQKENINVRIFDRRELIDGSVVVDFSDATGISLDGLEHSDHFENRSLNVTGQKILSKINKKLPRTLSNGLMNPERGEIHRVFEEYFHSGPKYAPLPSLVSAYREKFAHSHDWILENFFPGRQELFPERERAKAQIESLDDAALEQISDLILMLWKQRK